TGAARGSARGDPRGGTASVRARLDRDVSSGRPARALTTAARTRSLSRDARHEGLGKREGFGWSPARPGSGLRAACRTQHSKRIGADRFGHAKPDHSTTRFLISHSWCGGADAPGLPHVMIDATRKRVIGSTANERLM